jgi:hypothetical protein
MALSPEEQRQFDEANAARSQKRLWQTNPQLLSLMPDDLFAGFEAKPAGTRNLSTAFAGGILNKFRDVIADAQVKAQATIMRAQFELAPLTKRLQAAMDGLADLPQVRGIMGETVFDTRFAPQIFGGRDDEQTKLQRQMVRHLARIEQKEGGLPVA